MSGILLAAGVCAGGIFGAIQAASHGYEKLSLTIAISCIGTLAVAFLRRQKYPLPDTPHPVADGVFHAISHGIACVRPLQSPPPLPFSHRHPP